MGNSVPNHHEDHNAGKGENSLQHNNVVHKFIPMPQAMKIPAAKAAVDKEWQKLEKISAWNLEDSKSTSGGTLCIKSYICSQKLDVQETDCRFAQFNRI